MTQEFKDHIVQHPNRFKRVPVAGTTDQFDMIPTWMENPGEVVQLGTPIDRQLFEGITSQLAEKATNVDLVDTRNELQANVDIARTEVINNTRIKDLSISQIDKNKGKIDQTYLTDELLSQIAGGAPINATPADYSITAKKFAAPVVLGKKSKNLFDKTTTTEGFYVSHSTGNLAASANYAASDYIPVSPNTQYALSGTTIQLAFFNASKAYVSGIPNGVATPITTPATAAFVRLSMLKTEKDNVQFELGPSATAYESYPTKITRDQLSFNIDGQTLQGKNVLLLGDSITATQTRWVNKFLEITEPSSYVNVAVSGAHWKDYSGTTYPYDGNPSGGANQVNNVIGNQVQKVLNANYANIDVIIIAAGTNDNLNYENITVESVFTNNGAYIDIESIDRKTFAGAMRWSVEKLRNRYPNAEIFIGLQIQGNEVLRPYAEQKQKVDIVKSVANRLSAPIINAFDESGIYGAFENNGTDGRFLIDGLHPNATGGIKLGEFYASRVLQLYTK